MVAARSRTMCVALLVAWACLPIGMLAAATPDVARATINARDLRRHVSFLASDTLEGRAAGSHGGRAAGSYLVNEFRRIGLTPAGEGDDYLQEFGRGYRNALALLPGSDPLLRDEVVLIGAHYDHVGFGRPGNSFGPFGQIHNGADDNASGAAALLEAAEACAQLDPRPARTILFALWDAEEDGLLGSEHWAAHPTLPLQRVKLVVNMDMVGRLRGDRVTVYGARTATGLRRLAALANLGTGLSLDFDRTQRKDSDHWTFYRRDIPYLMFHTGDHDDYHRPSDDADKLNYEGLERVTQLTFEIARLAAHAAVLPG
ncbi:MAG: M20/M25/M40 family metallo-hydrolase, partial [Planctomycetaceae bacterium]|nr:M20/M25/M40 family metallo-hydrolase [Planctomycetaceae bacterium]